MRDGGREGVRNIFQLALGEVLIPRLPVPSAWE